MKNRQEYNKKIIEKLSKMVEEQPDTRFWQLLYNANIIRSSYHELSSSYQVLDDYNKESEEIYKQLNS